MILLLSVVEIYIKSSPVAYQAFFIMCCTQELEEFIKCFSIPFSCVPCPAITNSLELVEKQNLNIIKLKLIIEYKLFNNIISTIMDTDIVENPYEGIPTTLMATFLTPIQQLRIPSIQLHLSTQYDHDALQKIVIGLLQENYPDKNDIENKQFQFLIEDQMLRGTIKSHIVRYNIGCQKTIQIQYFLAFQNLNQFKEAIQDDWVSKICGLMTSQTQNKAFVSGLFNGSVALYDSSIQLIGKHQIQDSIIKSIASIPAQKQQHYYLISGGIDQTLKIHFHNLKSQQEHIFREIVSEEHGSPVSSLSINPALNGLFCSAGANKFHIYEIAPNLQDTVTSAIKSKQKNKKIHSSNAKAPMKPLQTYQQHEDGIILIQWLTTAEILTASMDHSIKIFDVQTKSNSLTIKTSDSITTSIDFSLDGNSFISSHQDGYLRFWDKRSLQKAAKTYKSHSKFASQVQFNPLNSNIFASSSYDNTIKIWDMRSIFPLQTITQHSDKVFTLLWQNSNSIVSGGCDSKIFQHYFSSLQ